MKKTDIVILDAVALRDGDMNFDPLKSVAGEFTVFDHTTNDKLIERIGNAEAIVINKGRIDDSVLIACPRLRYVGLTATGYDNIDVEACDRRGVAVTNVPGYSTEGVAQQLFALLLEYCVDTSGYSSAVKRGEWLGRMSDIGSLRTMTELGTKTLGILGFGNIGAAVARIALAFNMRVISYSPRPKSMEGVEFCSFDRLLAESDILSLHCLLSPQTERIINEKSLAKMKPSAVLCNVARGALIDDDAVLKALNDGRLSFYLADVLTNEPHTQDHPLIRCPNAIITPHVGWATEASLHRLAGEVCNNLISYFEGKPRNLVSKQ